MKKYGFTLQEILISLAIVGVVAAMTVPAIMGIMPDETKAKYMKAYNALTSLTSDIISDNTIYWIEYNAGNPVCQGLACRSNSTPGDFDALINAHPEFRSMLERTDNTYTTFNVWQGVSVIKFPIFLATRLNLQDSPNCTNNGRDCTFTTSDGMQWNITSAMNGARLETTVMVDVTNDDDLAWANKRTIDNAANPNDVDTFTFTVSNEGAVSASDALGRVFLRTPTDMHRKVEDRREAAGAQ